MLILRELPFLSLWSDQLRLLRFHLYFMCLINYNYNYNYSLLLWLTYNSNFIYPALLLLLLFAFLLEASRVSAPG